MISDEKWYVRNTAGKVFGPIGFETLKAWVRDGRVEPLAGVSKDLQNWMLAPLKPELEMDWIIENNPGQFYGPTHRAVVDDFLKSGTLSPGARFYCYDQGGSVKGLEAELAATKAAQAEREAKIANSLNVIEGLKAELAESKAELAATRAELEKLKAEKEIVHAREWKTEVLVPEVVVSDEPPPSVARTAFGSGPSSLAALERQAQAELARMGAAGTKGFFAFGKKKKG